MGATSFNVERVRRERAPPATDRDRARRADIYVVRAGGTMQKYLCKERDSTTS